LEIAHRLSDRQPHPMHESSPLRSAWSASICSSSRARQSRESFAQSARFGVRPDGSDASAAAISSSESPTLRAARTNASRRNVERS